ncbi:MAG: hypothetical protein UW63_C0081G0004 [Candidatus Uhrbacteria bacterium GW2011_GWF2_44_350]|uniref:Uncharacterized protein n=1 Tax=Candidatus Uhrbacteria bacterium GW2011_GWF2_44_350 TaxID=1619000 RepID=A0A0G1JAE0_9BACT|nr:MAG: hypothetical protein UW63_C0081G0004 [Candidatus Uhrbacteria bacterium GW2011_GWF2_44_350]HBR80441.1 hypothetical protein [Candidatus Uhrbacteria bacterium]HCU31436.1 hypothetical protein [Candidatus Uhrbacteria bacterium]
MERKEEDRIFGEITRTKKLLLELEVDNNGVDPNDIEQLRRDLIAAQDSFAAETSGTWVAIICGDYNVEGRPIKYLLPVSRFCGVESSFASYDFGQLHFTSKKKRTRVIGILLHLEYIQNLSTSSFENTSLSQYLHFGEQHSSNNIKLCVFATRDEAETWLNKQEGVYLDDILETNKRRAKDKPFEQQQRS